MVQESVHEDRVLRPTRPYEGFDPAGAICPCERSDAIQLHTVLFVLVT